LFRFCVRLLRILRGFRCALCTNRQRFHESDPDDGLGLFGGIDFYGEPMSFGLLPQLGSVSINNPRTGERVAFFWPAVIDVFRGNLLFSLNTKGEVVRVLPSHEPLILAQSWTALLEDLAQKLENGVFEVKPSGAICSFPNFSPLNSDTTTRGIRIRVATHFIPPRTVELSSPFNLLFSYRVRISYENDDDVRARLVSRHWIITNGPPNENRHEVHGEGVVGLFPEVYRGMEVFEYKSLCDLPSLTGKMEGSFHFVVEGSDEIIDAQIHPFYFDARVL